MRVKCRLLWMTIFRQILPEGLVDFSQFHTNIVAMVRHWPSSFWGFRTDTVAERIRWAALRISGILGRGLVQSIFSGAPQSYSVIQYCFIKVLSLIAADIANFLWTNHNLCPIPKENRSCQNFMTLSCFSLATLHQKVLDLHGNELV